MSKVTCEGFGAGFGVFAIALKKVPKSGRATFGAWRRALPVAAL
jgi:hypothetical protein